MRYAGRILKEGRYWAVEVPILHVYTQGRTRKEAYEMLVDAIEMLVDSPGFSVRVYRGDDGYLEVGSDDDAALIALLLRQQRIESGLTLVEVAGKLEARSHNAYARYEQGRCAPTVEKLSELLKALGNEFVLDTSTL
jgi:hypothetical protein